LGRSIILLDDRHWTIRYLVADTGNWLTGRQVLISPYAMVAVNRDHQDIVTINQKADRAWSSLDSDKPVSRQFEESTTGIWIPDVLGRPIQLGSLSYIVRDRENEGIKPGRESVGYHAQHSCCERPSHPAKDGELGTSRILSLMTRRGRFVISSSYEQLVAGKKVLVSPQWIERVSWARRKSSSTFP